MADPKHLEAVNRALREQLKELERQLIERNSAPGRAIVMAGEAPVVEQLEAILAFEPATVYALDHRGRIVQVTTHSARESWANSLIDASVCDQVHPDSADDLRHRLDQVLALGEPVTIELRARADDLHAQWYRMRLSPWYSEGALIGAIAVLAVIDDERRARIESKRFRAVLDQADEAIFVVDPRKARFVDVNTTACRLLRYTRDELLAVGPADVEADLPLGNRQRWADHMIEIMAVGTMVRESTYRRKDGSTFLVEETSSIKPFEGDEYLLMVCRDITEARRIKGELEKAEETLRVSDRLTTVGTLAAGVAHEINNPLAYVMGNIEFATDQIEEVASSLPDPARQEILESLEEARHGASRMSRIVRDLRTFSRRGDEDSVGPVAVNEVLDSSINIAMNEIRPRARLERGYTEDLRVVANEPRLGQVFLNLIINAAQAIPAGDSKNQAITVRTARAGGDVTVEVTDTGPGMPEEVVAQIFKPFFTTKPIGVGTGLGLSICQSIVEGLGGAITVDSQLGRGTTFQVRLPAATETAIRTSRNKQAKRAGKVGRILIIDDDARAAKALRRILYTHDVTIVGDGRSGLERVAAHSYDVIFCDMMMPDFGGIEFYEAMSDEFPALAPRVVFVTGGTFTQRAREFLEQTDNDFVGKPYDAPQVRRMVAARVR